MNNAIAIVVAGLVVAGSVWWSSPKYQIVGNDRDFMRINMRNGDVSFCRPFSMELAPVCSEYGSRTLEEQRAATAEPVTQTETIRTPPAVMTNEDKKLANEMFKGSPNFVPWEVD